MVQLARLQDIKQGFKFPSWTECGKNICFFAKFQKTALKVILADKYEDYTSALIVTGLDTLSERRKLLCKKFANNCVKSERMKHLFPRNSKVSNTRNPEKFYVQPATTTRLAHSAIPYMQRLLNED